MDGKNSEQAELALAEELFQVLSSNYDIPGSEFKYLGLLSQDVSAYHINVFLDPPPSKVC